MLPAAVSVPLGLLIFVSAVHPIAMNMYLPALPQMGADLGASSAALSATLSVFLIATAVAQLVVGSLSDIFGRRPILLAGLSLFVVGSAICMLAPDAPTLIAGRVVQAVGGCAGLALSRAIIRDISDATGSASSIGYVTMGIAVAPLVTPLIGGVIAEASSWRLIFTFMMVFAAGATLAAALTLKETHPPSGAKGGLARFAGEAGELLGDRSFWLFVMTLGSLVVAFFAFLAGGVFVADALYGLSVTGYGAFFMFVAAGYIAGNFVTGRYSARLGLVPMIVAGTAITLAGVAIATLAAITGNVHPIGLFGPMLLVGIGNGFAVPNAIAGAVSVRPRLAGTASGLAGAFQMAGGALATFIVGILIDTQYWPPSLWPLLVPMLTGSILAFVLSLFISSARIA